uniref:F-box only protein 8 isoform X1 n=1 Tax=Doryrhamphus excisus TaxID=161450 RepID=UPI0025ADF17E|nr:F-box only protein 8 isoform X1 [Doryrhamphus excisus]
MSDFGLCDAWRSYHPTHREYTYFSPVHHTYSRIDYFLTSSSILSDISNIHIHPIIISDHAPVSLFLTNQTTSTPTKCWRFNTSLLKDPDFLNDFEREWTMFLDFNDQPGTSACVLWETAKVVMRGKIISYSSYKKKKERLLELELEEKIKLLETAYANSQDENTLNNLRKLKLDLKEITDKKIQFQLQRLRLEKFEHANKSGKFLANQLKLNKEKNSISSIRNSEGNITHLPEEINSVFRDFYKRLYTPQINPSDPDIETFLSTIELPKLEKNQVTTLDLPISLTDLYDALQEMPNNKAPGPDGFPAEFYKTFWSLLAPVFFKMVQEIKENARLPPYMNSATISLLLKSEKDPTLPSSYRPISLINADLKIICKVLARRLEKVTPHIIHPDQSGFIKGRHSVSNVRRLTNLIDHSIIHNLETTIVSLDAEKAFDRVNWKFLFATLQKFGFGESFRTWIQILYSIPKASVRTNNLISPEFTLQRGTRQGCPLSPSLFAIFIEPLAAAIRQHGNIKGIQTTNVHHKISLYADDVLLFLKNSHFSLHQAITLINNFSTFSDYSINWSKSIVLPINFVFQSTPSIPLRSGNIRYLGINISSNLSDLISLNYTPLLKSIEDDLERWRTLPISLMGRVSTVKMMILPRINYLFSMIPTKPSITWFKSLDSYINKFLWKNKPARISLKTLQKSKECGGLELPNFSNYFLANRLQYILKWIKPNPLDQLWLDIEQSFSQEIPIFNLPFISQILRKHNCFKSINIKTTLTAWWEFLKITRSSLNPCQYTPIWNNPDILLKKKPLDFTTWHDKGISCLENIIRGGKFVSFTYLVTQYGLSQNTFLEYSQIKSIIRARFRNISWESYPTIDQFLNISAPQTLSKLYILLSKCDNTVGVPVSKWNLDLSTSCDPEFWKQICLNSFRLIKNPNLQLVQFKTIHRVHYTGQRMFKMGLTDSNICVYCPDHVVDDYLHSMWACAPISNFWQAVCEDLSLALGTSIPSSPVLCLLGDLSTVNVETNHTQLLITALSIAKKTILINWKSKKKLNIASYKNLLLDHIAIERMSAESKEQLSEFQSIWAPIINLLN